MPGTIRLVLCFLLCLHLRSEAQRPAIKFNLVEGVGEISIGKITGITQDPQGYMWFSDQDKSCITRFDGYQMVSFKNEPGNPNSLGGTYPETITADQEGIIWIGFYGMGLDRFDPFTGTFTHFRHNPTDLGSLANDSVTSIVSDHLGNIWVGNYGGLDLLDKKTGKFIHFKHNPDDDSSLSYDRIRVVYEDKAGTIWVGCGVPWELDEQGGLNRFDRKTGKFTRYLHKTADPSSIINNKVRSIFEDSRGNFWIGTSGDGLHTMDRSTGKFIRHRFDPRNRGKLSRCVPRSPVDHITFITEDGAGGIWIGTFEAGINRYDPVEDTTIRYAQNNGYPDNSGWVAFTSREGVVWMSTQENNLYRVDPRRKNFLRNEFGLALHSFVEDKDGSIWAACPTGLIKATYDGKYSKKMAQFEEPISTFQFMFMNMKPGNDNDLWIANGGNVYHYDRSVYSLRIAKRGMPGNRDPEQMFIWSVLPDGPDAVWLGGQFGVIRMHPATGKKELFKLENRNKEITDVRQVACLFKDSRGTIWAGTYFEEGLYSFSEKSGRFVPRLVAQSVTCIFEDADSTLWVGTTNGLYHKTKQADHFTLFTMPGIPVATTEIAGIVEDDKHHLWVSSKSGIFRINRQRTKLSWYGASQGLNTNAFTRGIIKMRSGKILIGTTVGFYAFDPGQMLDNPQPPQVVIRDLRISDKPVTPGKNEPLEVPLELATSIRLNYDQDIFSIGFAGMHYSNPVENAHMYMLEGFDPAWRRADNERTAYYFNVPPGNYVFRVKASNSEEVWAERSIQVVIVPAWWNTLYFRVPALLVLIGLLYLGIRWRTLQLFRRQLERAATDRELADLRHRSAMLEMQALRSQMNPHFIFNSLNSINHFILQNNKQSASAYLTKFSRLVRLILQHSEHAMIPLENELQALELYLDLEAVRFDNQFTYRLRVSDDLNTDLIRVPPLIFQPFAENAIWHGLMHKAEKGHLDILLASKDGMLVCTISDNGIGRKRANELQSKSAAKHRSMGMKITAGRIEMLRRTNNAQANVTVNDLVMPDGSAGGTEVVIKIPLHYDKGHNS